MLLAAVHLRFLLDRELAECNTLGSRPHKHFAGILLPTLALLLVRVSARVAFLREIATSIYNQHPHLAQGPQGRL
jgi:hypothetical protein